METNQTYFETMDLTGTQRERDGREFAVQNLSSVRINF